MTTGVNVFRPSADERFNERRQRRIDRDHNLVDTNIRSAQRHAHIALNFAEDKELDPALKHRREVHKDLIQARRGIERLRDAPPLRGYFGLDAIQGVEAARHDDQFANAAKAIKKMGEPVTELKAKVERARKIEHRRIEKLDSFLRRKGSPMAGQGETFYRVGKQYGIDPRFLIAISGQESKFGTMNSASYNAFGYFGTAGGPTSFSSWEAAIRQVAWQLAGPLYMSAPDYPKDSVYSIGATWAPVGAGNDPGGLNGYWPDGVQTYLDQQGANNYEVTWRGYIEDITNRYRY